MEDWIRFTLEHIWAPLLVGISIALFTHWLNRHK